MTTRTFSSQQFKQDASEVEQAANERPVFITDRGRLAYVLLSIEDCQRLALGGCNTVNALAMPGAEDIGFEPPQAHGLSRPTGLP